MKDYPDYYNELKGLVAKLHKVAPNAMTAHRQLNKSATAEGALDTKSKQLIALAVAVAVRCDGCIAYHVADAIRARATREEVAEAIGVAVLMGGSPAVIYGAQALQAFEQFEANPKEWA